MPLSTSVLLLRPDSNNKVSPSTTTVLFLRPDCNKGELMRRLDHLGAGFQWLAPLALRACFPSTLLPVAELAPFVLEGWFV